MDRNRNIDFFRGVAIIAVIFINTVFWSGESYVPGFVRSLSLLVDVPLFFLVAGMVFAASGQPHTVESIYKFIVFFVGFSLFYDLAAMDLSFTTTIDALLLRTPAYDRLPVLAGSYWIVPVYCVSALCLSLLIRSGRVMLIAFPVLSFLFYLADYFGLVARQENYFFGADVHYLLFYCSLMTIGYVAYAHMHKEELRLWGSAFLIIVPLVGLIGLAQRDGLAVLAIEDSKFPVRLPYVLASLFSMAAVLLLWGRVRMPALVRRIGRGAVFYYLAQGVGATALYAILPYVEAVWFVRLILAFVLNFAITMGLAEAMMVMTGFASQRLKPAAETL